MKLILILTLLILSHNKQLLLTDNCDLQPDNLTTPNITPDEIASKREAELSYCQKLNELSYRKCLHYTTCNFCSANEGCGWCIDKCIPAENNTPTCQLDCQRIQTCSPEVSYNKFEQTDNIIDLPELEYPQFERTDLENTIDDIQRQKVLLWLRGFKPGDKPTNDTKTIILDDVYRGLNPSTVDSVVYKSLYDKPFEVKNSNYIDTKDTMALIKKNNMRFKEENEHSYKDIANSLKKALDKLN
jgi:hypothetical protein